MKYIKHSENEKLKNTHLSLLCLCITCVLFITFTQVVGNTLIKLLGIAMYLCIMVLSDKRMVLPLLLFFLPWIDIIKFSPESISFASIVTLLLIPKFIYEGWHIEKRSFFCVIIIFVLSLLSKVYHGYEITTSYLMFFATIIMYNFILSNERESIAFDKCIYFYAIGLITASLMAIALQNSQNISTYIRVQHDAHSVQRVTGFIGDANFYSSQILPAFAGVLLLLRKNRYKSAKNILLAICLAVVGLMAVSKSFFVCLMMVIICYMLSVSMREKRNIVIIFAIGVAAFLAISTSGVFSNLIEAYTTRFTTSTDMEELTTGRDLIWKNYMEFFYNNPLELLLGQGLTYVFNTVYKGSHNTIIQCLYQLGIIGSLTIIIWGSCILRSNRIRYLFPVKMMWIIGCFSMWLGLDLLFFDDFFCILSLYSIGMVEIGSFRNSQSATDKTYQYIR